MQKSLINKTIISLAFILAINSILLPVILPGQQVKADSSISKDDLYTGLGLMFLLIVLAGDKDKTKARVNREDFYDQNNFSAAEIEVLAKIINAEARGESYQGKVAVGAVIMNRVYDPAFPNTIRGVVYQKGQFKPVENGSINLSANSDSFKAAYDAINGIDPTHGCLYFYNPTISENPQFFAKRTRVIRIGNHVFLK